MKSIYKLQIDRKGDNMSSYRIASKKALDTIDEYAEDFVEIDSLGLLTLNIFEYLLIEDMNKCLFQLFNGIIELLDYYEHFSKHTLRLAGGRFAMHSDLC